MKAMIQESYGSIEGLHASGDYEMSLGAGNRHRRQPGRPLTPFSSIEGQRGRVAPPLPFSDDAADCVVNAHGCGVHG